MGCCNNKRTNYNHSSGIDHYPDNGLETGAKSNQVKFQYTGKSRMTAIGTISRNKYSFDEQGATLTVDERDVPSLMGVPGLKRVKQ